jgi:hypothetical protein
MATTMTTSAEKRGSRRVDFHCEVECYGVGGGSLNPRIADISASGAFIDTLSALPAGSRFTLEIRGSEPTCLTAEVVHSMPQIGMGVRFVNLTPAQREALDLLVNGASR